MNIITFNTLMLYFCVVLPLQADTCAEINAADAINIAQQKGYSFTLVKVAGKKGSCNFVDSDNSIVIGVAALDKGPITCEAGFFLGEIELREGWTITESPVFEVLGSNYQYVQAPAYGTNKPGFKIIFDVEPENPVVLQLNTISLEGPECEKWKDAF